MGKITVPKRVDNLRKFIEKRLIGQPKAVELVCKIYEYSITLRKLEQAERPLGVFLFLGPSGSGKTEMARLMAEYLCGSKKSLITIPCGSFSEPHRVSSIIGSPPGYIGFNDDPLLSEKYINKRLDIGKKKNSDIQASAIARAIPQYDIETRIYMEIESRREFLYELRDEIELNQIFIGVLSDYDNFVHNFLTEDGRSSKDILRDFDRHISDLAKMTASKDISDPGYNAAELIDLYANTKNLIITYRGVNMDLQEKIRHLTYLRRLRKSKTSPMPKSKSENNRSLDKTDRIAVILFDEIEKGNETLHNLLLEAMEEGRITLANNKITDLRNAFIILTSNIGARKIANIMNEHKAIGFSTPKINVNLTEVLDADSKESDILERKILGIASRELDKIFSSEFRGRIDGTVVFRPLSPKNFLEILDLHIELFREALLSEGVDLEVEEDAKKLVIERSLHRPESGARLLEQKLRSLIKIPVGRVLGEGGNFKGKIRVYVKDSQIKLELKNLQ